MAGFLSVGCVTKDRHFKPSAGNNTTRTAGVGNTCSCNMAAGRRNIMTVVWLLLRVNMCVCGVCRVCVGMCGVCVCVCVCVVCGVGMCVCVGMCGVCVVCV